VSLTDLLCKNNTRNVIFRRNTPILGAIDWHSYSQLILRPFGWTADDAPDEVTLKALGDRMSEAAYEVSQFNWVIIM
jgi:hypothetical protein